MKLLLIILYVSLSTSCKSQGYQPVIWLFKAETTSGNEGLVTLSAQIAPGWHLYSQFMKSGGPPPTKITFESSDNYLPIGKIEENGRPVKFYDETFDMEITWYTTAVSFSQRVKSLQTISTVKGKIDYMVCSEHRCIPLKQEFNIDISPLRAPN